MSFDTSFDKGIVNSETELYKGTARKRDVSMCFDTPDLNALDTR